MSAIFSPTRGRENTVILPSAIGDFTSYTGYRPAAAEENSRIPVNDCLRFHTRDISSFRGEVVSEPFIRYFGKLSFFFHFA